MAGICALGTLYLGGALAAGMVKAGANSLTWSSEDLKKAEGTEFCFSLQQLEQDFKRR